MNTDYVEELSRQLESEIPEAAHDEYQEARAIGGGFGKGFLANLVRSKLLAKLVGQLPELIETLVAKDAVRTAVGAALDAIAIPWVQVILKDGAKRLILDTIDNLYDSFTESNPPRTEV